MSKFKVADRVVVNRDIPRHPFVKAGMVGVIIFVEQTGYGYTYTVKIDGDHSYDHVIHESFLDKEKPKMETILRIDGPRGFTETLSEAQVNGLVAAGVLFHNSTVVYNDHILKVYNKDQSGYEVIDRRTNKPGLHKEFPRDNQ